MSADEPDNFILVLLRQMREEMGEMRAETVAGFADVRSEIHSLPADVASDIAVVGNDVAKLDKKTGEQFVSLRRTVMEYHSSVIGHGVLTSELDARMRRVEQHLNLPALDPH